MCTDAECVCICRQARAFFLPELSSSINHLLKDGQTIWTNCGATRDRSSSLVCIVRKSSYTHRHTHTLTSGVVYYRSSQTRLGHRRMVGFEFDQHSTTLNAVTLDYSNGSLSAFEFCSMHWIIPICHVQTATARKIRSL